MAGKLGNFKLYNVALGGMTSQWGKENAEDLVALLKPDLAWVAFGMTDFWSISASEFRRNIEAIMATVRMTRPSCEFILIASMKFDPAYTSEPIYVTKLPS